MYTFKYLIPSERWIAFEPYVTYLNDLLSKLALPDYDLLKYIFKH